jgi:uncharacterized membrane protein YeaQ/YmgE (transglycosylase-associated protein family)
MAAWRASAPSVGGTVRCARASSGEISASVRIELEDSEERVSRMLNLNSSLATFLVWMFVGGVAGWLASLVVRGTGVGLLGDIVVGILGAFLGGLVLALLQPGTLGVTGPTFGSLIVVFVGAVILLLVVRVFSGRGSRARA